MSKLRVKLKPRPVATTDSIQNFLARVGIGTGNIADGARYGFNPVTRNRVQMEWVYRGSWIAGQVIDAVAEDMTREGVTITSDDTPQSQKELEEEVGRLQIWTKLCEAIKWARLYGGALAVMLIDGQDMSTPLRPETVGKGQFKGLLALDRWAVQPSLTQLVTELGPDLGKPLYYEVVLAQSELPLPRTRIHYSRVIRLEGIELPYQQRITENYWGQSVLERLWDRLVAFDSTTAGAAQLVYKAHLRTYKVPQLRDIIATGGPPLEGLLKQIEMIRRFQSNEGMTLMDKDDEFEAHQYTFSGLDNVLLQMGQQLSGATGIPLVRLFGQSPAGLNSTGESDLRTYYDNIKQQQESRLRSGVEKVYQLTYTSKFGRAPSRAFGITFNPLWQLTDEQRAEIVTKIVSSVVAAYEAQIIDRATALRELKKIAELTGTFSNIADEAIKQAENDPPPTPEALGLKLPDPGPKAEPGSGKEGPGADRAG